MKFSLAAGLLLLAACLLFPQTLAAQAAPPTFAFAKQYSADMIITTKDGNVITNKVYMSDGKVRTEMSMRGMTTAMIVRPDQQKIYTLMVAQKMLMETPLDPAKYQKMMGPAGPDAKFVAAGADTVEGVACQKYTVTAGDGKVSDLWVDAAKQIPVKLAAEDGSYTASWKNYVAGPQAAALFEPPADYQKAPMPTGASADH